MNGWKMEGKPALVIIHMQEGIVGKNGVPGQYEVVRKAGIIPRQQALLKAFREKKLPVIYVNTLHATNALNPAPRLPVYGNLFQAIQLQKPNPNDLDVIPDLAPQPGEPVLKNWMIGAFTNSGLEQVLKACGVEIVVLVGCATNITLYTTALQAVERWYSVIMPNDTCISPAEQVKGHEAVLEIMAPNIALVTSSEDVIAHL